MFRLLKAMGRKFEPSFGVSPKEELESYIQSVKNDFDIILENQGWLRDCEQWIKFGKDFRCYNNFCSDKIGEFFFTYKGKTILYLHIRTENKELDYMECALPDGLTYESWSHNSKKYRIFTYSNSNSKMYSKEHISMLDVNPDYDLALFNSVIRKCVEGLYKKAVIRNEKRIQFEMQQNQEKEKQKKIDQERRQNYLKEFSSDYIINISE